MRFYLTTILVLFAASTFSQATDEDEAIKEVIHRVFKAMELGDSAMLRTTFVDNPATATVFRSKADEPMLRQDAGIENFLKAVGTPHQEVWYEEVWDLEVRRDGDMAQAWCEYAFYVGNKFSHCGVDVFHLFRSKEGWKIFHLADTRRTTGCDIPQEVQDKHN